MWISKKKYKAMEERIKQLEKDKKELQAFRNTMESSLVLDSKEIFKAVQKANCGTSQVNT